MLLKFSPKVMNDLLERVASLRAIDANLDLGNGLTLANFEAKVMSLQALIMTYNSQKSDVDGTKSTIDTLLPEVMEMFELMLLAVAVRFGKNSDEYVKAGGTKRSERKKPSRIARKKE